MTDNQQSFVELCRRYTELYTPAVADVLDDLGYKNQALPNEIDPIDPSMKVAGYAVTAKGTTTACFKEEYIYEGLSGLSRLGELSPGAVFVIDTSHDNTVAHFGELMANLVRQHGCVGAVVDGGVRDVAYLKQMGFPVFGRYTSVVDAIGRFRGVEHQVPIKIGNCVINPGDFVFGDVNGVVVVPQGLIEKVLVEAEKVVEKENKIRKEIGEGGNALEIYRKYGRF